MNAFWERGYEGVSIEDLVQCTSIGRGRLYDTFDDKHSLHLAALDRSRSLLKRILFEEVGQNYYFRREKPETSKACLRFFTL